MSRLNVSIIVGLILLCFGLGCIQTSSRTTSEPKHVESAASVEHEDVLFFIDGQLCQHVRKLYQTKNGDIWIGTNIYGIMRYDGKELIRYNRKSGHDYSRITGFVEDDKGNLWIGSSQGLIKFDGETFAEYNTSHGLIDNEIWCLNKDQKGVIWIGTTNGVSKFDGSKFEHLSIPKAKVDNTCTVYAENRVTSIEFAEDGTIWFGTDGYGISIYDGSTFRHLTKTDGLPGNCIGDIHQDTKSNIWMGSSFGGIARMNEDGFRNYTKEGLVQGVEVSGIYEDRSEHIWFAVENHGVYEFDGKEFIHYGESEGLVTNGILCFLEGHEGRMWLGGWGGLFRLIDGKVVSVGDEGPWE